MGKKVEVEGGELAIQNSNGDIAIVPKKYAIEVQGMIDDGCNDCIDDFVSKLPKESDYAEDGTVVSELWKEKTGTEWSEAHNKGLTKGTYDDNMALRKRLIAGEFDTKRETYDEYKQRIGKLNPNLAKETPDYNLRGAYEGGLEPGLADDGTYHLGSRNPITGEILKSPNHPTWNKFLKGEEDAGYEVYQKEGKYFSKEKEESFSKAFSKARKEQGP